MSRKKGNKAEQEACDFLESKGFDLLERNFYSRFGEIDIIASKEGALHFVEVKSALEYDTAVANITPAKLRKIILTAQTYMQKIRYEGDFIFDALIVTPQTISFIENITL